MCLHMVEPRVEHEQHRKHDQSHVTVPGRPLSSLVLRHTDMTFGVLKTSLDPEPLALHLHKSDNAGSLRCVTQTVFDCPWRIDFSSDNQMPAVCSRAAPVPHPNSLMQHFHDQLSLCRVTQGFAPPARSRLFLDPLAHLHRVRLAHVTLARPAGLLRWQVRGWITQINVSIRVDVGHEDFIS